MVNNCKIFKIKNYINLVLSQIWENVGSLGRLYNVEHSILIFWNIMQYFSFSSKLSMFYEVIRNAFFDVTFFIIMQAIIMCGYALIGFMLFGISDEVFSTFSNSCLTLFQMIIGSKSVLNISTPGTTTVFLSSPPKRPTFFKIHEGDLTTVIFYFSKL